MFGLGVSRRGTGAFSDFEAAGSGERALGFCGVVGVEASLVRSSSLSPNDNNPFGALFFFFLGGNSKELFGGVCALYFAN